MGYSDEGFDCVDIGHKGKYMDRLAVDIEFETALDAYLRTINHHPTFDPYTLLSPVSRYLSTKPRTVSSIN